jgi:glycosyltransferase involved in cell wall biosynthesis
VKHLQVSPDQFSLIPNFYVEEDVDRQSDGETLPDDFILYVGALTPLKGVDLLIDAYRRVSPDVPLVLIGARHPAYTYRRFHDGDNVILIEDAPRHLVLQAYERCRFVVIPSRWPEPCPTVAFEAMHHGKAILASNVGGLPDLVVHAKTGYLFTPDEDSLPRALRAVLQRPRIEELGAEGRNRFAARYTLEKVAPRIESAYRALR